MKPSRLIKLSKTQRDLLHRAAKAGREFQARVSSNRATPHGVITGSSGALRSTILALKNAGFVTTSSESSKETRAGFTTYYTEVYVTITDAGRAALAESR